MKIKKVVIVSILVIFFTWQNFAQPSKQKIDSLYSVYLKEKTDTGKVNVLVEISVLYKNKERVKGISFAREALEIARKINFLKGICYSASVIADYYYDQLNYPEALKNYLVASEAGEKARMSLELSKIYNAMGIMYSNQGSFEQAQKYFLKVSKISEEQHMQRQLAVSYNNIGICFKNLGRLSEAKRYYNMALEQFEKMKFRRGIASANSNLGIVNHMMKDDEKALENYNRAIDVFRSINDTVSEAGIYTNIGELYRDKKDFQRSLEYYVKGMEKARLNHNINFTDNAYEGISKLYADLHDYEKAYHYNQLHLALKDSITNQEGMQQVREMEKRLENEKQEAEIRLLKQDKEIQDLKVSTQSAKLRQNSVIIYSVIGIMLIVIVMSFFIFKAYRQIKQTNIELAEKKKEIQDSINYAKNIQEAMLPDTDVLRKYFPEGFGLFMPKDIVSGDFYWFSELNGKIFFAVADCTGHGVPGGFMSMIGIDKLHQSLSDKKLENLSDILSFLNQGIKKALKQTTDSSLSRDGMDIAICSFDRKNMELKFAGANRPLWIIRNEELIEIKATKASIGGFTEDATVFKEHSILLHENDLIYLFSDGFADQFGGNDKKKFMTRRLKDMLLENHQLPMHEQEIKYMQIFNEWRMNQEQVDDVLLFGVRI